MIIAIANQKGRVGKTTLSVHLAVYAAQQGRRVLLVDADPQGNASSWLLDGDQPDGMYRLLLLNEPSLSIVRRPVNWKFGLLPGNYRTGEALAMLGAVNRLAEIPLRIKALAESADVVFVDMPPSRMSGFLEILSAAKWVIVPTQLERLSLEGVALLAHTLYQQQGGPRLMGIVPNMVRARTSEHQAQMQSLVDSFGATVWPPIPLTIRVTEATSFGTTLFDMAPHCAAACSMRAVGRRMMEVLDGGQWQ